jgi:hypothetical protein
MYGITPPGYSFINLSEENSSFLFGVFMEAGR